MERLVRVLAVDDMPANLLAMEAALEPLGVDVAIATSGERALEMVDNQSFAVILLDYMMPGLDGLETLARLRGGDRPNQTPVVILTAHSSEPDLIRKAYALGAFDFIEKPISPEVLRGKVSAFVTMHNAVRGARQREAELAARERKMTEDAEALSITLASLRYRANLMTQVSASDLQNAAARLARSAQWLTVAVGRLLDHATDREDGPPIARAHVNLSLLCARTLAELEHLHPHVVFEKTIAPDVQGSIDEGGIEQLLQILVSNAANGPSLAVELSSDGDTIELTVRDRLRAIPKWALRSLFMAGAGGLWMDGSRKALPTVHSIALAHGGDVRVISDEAGTGFVVRLPVAGRS